MGNGTKDKAELVCIEQFIRYQKQCQRMWGPEIAFLMQEQLHPSVDQLSSFANGVQQPSECVGEGGSDQ